MRLMQSIARPVAFAVCLALLPAIGPAAAESADHVLRTVTVSASGHVEAKPDFATINTGVGTDAATAREAMANNNAEMTKVVEGLKATGIPAKDIQTSALQLNPRYSNAKDSNTPSIIGYSAFNQVHIKLHDIARVGDVLDQLVTLGANRINGIAFGVSAEETLRDEARKAAMINAHRRAELFAAAEGVELGTVITISENAEYAGPVMSHGGAMAPVAKFAAPIEPGEQRLEATVYVTYQLK